MKRLRFLALVCAIALVCVLTEMGVTRTLLAQDSMQPTQRHPLPQVLSTWQGTTDSSSYFAKIKPVPLGYLVWSQLPVSIYVSPSHFTDDSRREAWEQGVQQAIADWQAYFPLVRVDEPDANIVIEQVRPQKTSQGRVRSAQATPTAYCEGDRLAHRFAVEISPSQTGPYIKAAARHELGHALGLWGHSSNMLDVMYSAQVADPPSISERDINTLKQVYEQPTLLGWPAPKYCPANP